MKRLFYILLLTFIGMTAFSQSSAKYVNLLPAYPPAVGEAQYDNYVYTNSGLYMHDIILDSLPHYEIEHIPDQTVRFFEDGIGFYVKADSLHSNQVVYSYTVDIPPIGPFEFNATTGRFKFYPDAGDYRTFNVTFTATAGLNSLSQTVEFVIIPEVVPEYLAIQNLGEMPSTEEYTIRAESQTEMFLNNANRTVYSYSISGKDVVFDNDVQNKVWGLSEREDLYELNIFAERLYIRSALTFPHTNVNIYARELIFEDKENEIASINTTPSAIGINTLGTGMDGEDAGNITLYINKLAANYAKRFILNGAKGQNAIRNDNGGTPGDGGNGGVLIAPIDVECYCDFSRGSAGLRYKNENGLITIDGAAQVGENGHFELITDQYSWIHPYYIAAVIRHINDSYLNNYFTYSKTTANDYYNLINEFEASDEWDNLDGTLKVELLDQRTELQGMLYKLNENLDYFGNPLGWAPMLSFEVLLNNYNNEIDRAMPTLYLNYWLQHIDQTMESWATASAVAASQTQSDIAAAQDQINSLTYNIPVLEDKIAVLQNQIEQTQNRLEQIQDELLRKATHNVKKRNRLNKAFGIAKAALNCIPVYGQIASGIVQVVQTVGSDYFGLSDTYGYESAITDAYQSITNFDYGSALNTLQQAIDSIDLNHLGQTGHQLKDCYNSLKTSIGPVYNSITNLQQTLSHSSAPDDQVQAELDKLLSESAEYQNIKAEISALQKSYAEFGAILTQTFANIVNLTSEVSNEMVTLDALRNDVFQGNSQRDLQAMQCVEKMRQRAMNRLVKYHYYMRKAYEYRLLRPYQGEFSLETMYNRIEALIDQGQIIFDNSTPANLTDYSALSAVFRQEVSGVIEDVIDELVYNAPEQTASISFIIPKEVLDKINANEEYDLNMFDLGLFSPDEENIRIVGFDVQYMKRHIEGNIGTTTRMDLEFKHNGISRFRKNGEVYWFNHVSTSTLNPYPNTWKIRYDTLNLQQPISIIEPSLDVQSLLYSLLDGNAQNIMLFSRPAAWSNIIMSKNVYTNGDADVIIDSLILSLEYNFTNRPDAIRNIDIATSDDLLAYITCSEVDKNGRSNGKGSFHRSYTRSNGTVTFTAMETHGTYHFVNWTDRLGNVVTENPALTINKMTDQFYRANYERWIPVISVADTIFVSNEGGEYEVQIRNVGLGDIEMDWYVSDSLSTWVHVNGIAEGIDDGFFTFTYEANDNGGMRIDSLEILAPEIEGMSKTIYIVQYGENHMEISACVNPEGAGTVVGTGFYEQGNICTLTATANEGYTFVNWTKNGQQVSMNPTYSFTVTENASYVANFASTIIHHWTYELGQFSDNMNVLGMVAVNGEVLESEYVEVGAFCGEECRSSEFLMPVGNQYLALMTIGGEASDMITFRAYDHLSGQEIEGTCTYMVEFEANALIGMLPDDPVVWNFVSVVDITQTTNFNNGWTWWSTCIETANTDVLGQLKAGLSANGQVIKSQTASTMHLGNNWVGSLTMTNEGGYMVKSNAAVTVNLTGPATTPENHPITLNSGWTWIGYPTTEPMNVATALANHTPQAGDVLKGQGSSAMFMMGSWHGALTLTPGVGLMYKSNKNEAVTFTYATPTRMTEAAPNLVETHWNANYNAYPTNMTVLAVVELDDEELSSENYELTAFAGDECRGSVAMMYVEPLDRYMALLTISGEEVADLYFGLYNAETGEECFNANETLTYETDAIVGIPESPFVIHFRNTTSADEWSNHLQIFPNPVEHGQTISLGTTSEIGEVQVEIINALGVVETRRATSLQTITAPNVAGVYTLRITIEGKGTCYKRLIVR
jgi:uncharacterized protein YlxW (UPF0749 family)